MESILELLVSSMVVALVQAHSHKKLTGFSQTAEICHERSSQAPGVSLGRNCRSLSFQLADGFTEGGWFVVVVNENV